jgi:cytochrome P450
MKNSFNEIYPNETKVLNRKHLLSNTLHVLKNPVDFFGKLTKDYGPIATINFLGKKYFIVQHPESIKHVLLQNHKTYYKGAAKLLSIFLGDGLSTSNGELWLRQRRIMQPAFHKQRLLVMLNIINEETTSFISRLNIVDHKKPINISQEFLQLTISIISRAMFSTALKEEMQKMVDTLEALASYASAWMKAVIKVPVNWPTPANNKFKNNCKVFDDIIYGIIKRRRNRSDAHDPSVEPDLLDMLMDYYDEETKCGIPDKQLRDEATTMFMAGHETTAQTLSWIIYHLAKDKEIYYKVKNEGNVIFAKQIPAFDDLPDLVYTKQVIQEGLRHYPPVWALVRKPFNDDVINGIKIPALSTVLINIYGMHHHVGHWQTPEVFNPEHFNKEQQEQRHPYAYLPFGGGPRLCLGNGFAMMVMQVVISRLCQHFEFDVPDGYEPKVEPNITLRAKDGIRVILKV